jgi:2-hydroxymuconate-semialdehyde hydrolase
VEVGATVALVRDSHPLPGTDHLVDGVRLHVVDHGFGERAPVVLLHGVPTSSYLWRDVQRDLAPHHRTYAPDLVGLGESERPVAGRYDLAAQAELMLHLLDSLGVESCAVVGHGVGGGVALHLAATAPERVGALVLVDVPAHPDVWPAAVLESLRTPVLGEAQLAALRLVPTAARRYLGSLLARGLRSTTLGPRELQCYAAPLLTVDGGRGLLSVVRALDPEAVVAALSLVAAEPPRTLVLWGSEDAWHGPAYGRRLADTIPGSRFVEVADAGHLLPEDRPERVAEEIEAFLAD